MFELLPVTSDYVATVFSLRKGSSTNHYWEQLTLVSVKWPWDETVHLKFHENWPVWESSNWIFLASETWRFLLVHINPVVSDLGFTMIHLIQIASKISSSPFTRKSRFDFLQATIELSQDLVSLVIEFQNGMKHPQNREVWTKKTS